MPGKITIDLEKLYQLLETDKAQFNIPDGKGDYEFD